MLRDDLGWAYGRPGISTGPGQALAPAGSHPASAASAASRTSSESSICSTASTLVSNFLVQDDDSARARKASDGDRKMRRESTASWLQRLKETVLPELRAR